MSNNAYSFMDCVAALVGPGVVASLGNGSGASEEGIDVAATGDSSGMIIGADGSGIHSLYADKSGTLTVRLLKNSPMNTILSAAYALQRSSSSLHGQNTITIFDKARGDVVTATQCAFKKAPDLSYAKDATPVEWVFDSVRIERILGN